MKKAAALIALFIGGAFVVTAAQTAYKPQTIRQSPQYLSTDPALVEDTCPGHDILNRFTCRKKPR